MGRKGRKRRLELETRYWALLAGGVGSVEACRQLGIGRKTGYRWRAECGGIPPGRLPDEARSTRYLNLLERQRIATLRAAGHSIREVARRLGRSASTVSRELQRNTFPHDRGGYDATLAHARATGRSLRPRRGRLLDDPALRATVQDKLEIEWSPEQIAAWLRTEYPDRPGWHVCHETIYQALYNSGRSGLCRTLTTKLRTRRPLRRRRRRAEERRIRFITPSQSIDKRPAVVETRCRTGDWEGDLIVGRSGRSSIGTLVERRSRYVRLLHLPGGHRAEPFAEALGALFQEIPEQARWTMTWDQGSEMARHDLFGHLFADGVYFAHPASLCLRGTNENTNGLLRQYFPKGTDLSVHDGETLREVEDRLNNRPRKSLGWRTPAQVFAESLAP
ncbi:IS30 family transposase [Rhodococcus rhodochrous]|uniref:Integrase catalytic domain-containing protein n=1 Tax=Rhodococcus rhodochrous KG-21 TaxID=1441923 RepID=A0A0M8PJJ4_RHORH|nr:hypothetical protein Z051_03735 [Rhodococcus rhodochrous KG-21]